MISREGEYGEFETLEKEKLYQTLDDIEASFNIETTLDPFGERGNESDSNAGNESQEPAETEQDSASGESDNGSVESGDEPAERGGRGEPSSDSDGDHERDESESPAAENGDESTDDHSDQSESTTDSATTSSDITTTETTDSDSGSETSEDSVSNATTQESDITLSGDDSDGSQSNESGATEATDSDVPDEVVDEYGSESAFDQDTPEGEINPEGGIPDEDIPSLSNAGEDGSSSGENAPGEENATSKHERFKTYSDPGDEVGEFDADREAVKQFVNQFATVDPHSKDETYTKRETVYNAFTAWYKINKLDTEKLTTDKNKSNRKGDLKSILTTLFDLEVDRRSENGVKTVRYYGIELSESCGELIEINVE